MSGLSPFIAEQTFAQALLTTTAHVATCAVPPLRRLLFGQSDAPRFSAYLPFAGIDLSGTVTHTNGRLTSLHHLRGVDHDWSPATQQDAHYKQLVAWIAGNGANNTATRIYSVRDHAIIPAAPGHPSAPMAAATTDYYRSLNPAYHNAHYVALTATRTGGQGADDLRAADQGIKTELSPFDPSRVTQEQGAAAGFWADLVAPVTRPRPAGTTTDSLASALSADEAVFNTRAGWIRWGGEDDPKALYAAVWTITALGTHMAAAMTEHLLALPRRLVLMQAWNVHSTATAIADLGWKKNLYVKAGGGESVRKIFEGMIEKLRAKKTPEAFAAYGWQLMVYGSSPADLERAHEQVREATIPHGFRLSRETTMLIDTFKGFLPPHPITLMPRDFFASNIGAHLAFGRSSEGFERSQWLDKPVFHFLTHRGDLFPFAFHCTAEDNDPSAHCAVFGVPGSGKTTTVANLAAQLLRNRKLKVFCLDNLKGLYCFTKSLGSKVARYIELTGDKKSAQLNPCRMPDTTANRIELAELLKLMIGGARANDLPPHILDDIDFAVRLNFHPATPPRARSFRNLLTAAFVPPSGSDDPWDGFAYRALERWVKDDSYSAYFGDGENTLDFDTFRWVAFDFEEIIKVPHIASVLAHYLFHSILDLINRLKIPVLIIVDEAAELFRLPSMVEWGARIHEQFRKLDSAIVTMWQRFGQLAQVGMTSIVKQMAPTKLFFPDANMDPDEYAPLRLQPAHLDAIAGRHSAAQRMTRPVFLYRTGQIAMLEADLSAYGRNRLRMFAGRKGANRLRDLEARYPEDLALAEYLKDQEIPYAA
jgi:type IV secretory pathway VirB4 component